MAGSLYMLRDFFRTGRNAKGGYMGDNEDMINATERNLSLQSDDELLALRSSAEQFIAKVNEELVSRDADDEEPEDDEEPFDAMLERQELEDFEGNLDRDDIERL